MKLLVVNKLVINRGWRLIEKTSRTLLFAPDETRQEEHLIILPAKSSTPLPAGTVDTIMRRVNQTKPDSPWPCALSRTQSLELIVEKAADVLWGRISVNGLFLVVRGSDTNCLTKQIQEILIDLMTKSVDTSRLPQTPSFAIRYDMTEVWSFLRQMRPAYIADMTGIELATINRFITGTAFPSPEQMAKIQQSFQELGNQLLRLSG